MKTTIKTTLALIMSLQAGAVYADIQVAKVSGDLSKAAFDESFWKGAKEETVSLMAQPMAVPRPKMTTTSTMRVQAVQDGHWIAFRLRWKAESKNEGGKWGEFSDAVAIQFPVKEGPPPPVFMGGKDNPVHIVHWRAQYQRDVEKGKPEMKELYPNMNPDMYPMEFKDSGRVKGLSDEKREVYSPAKAVGNPQSYRKASAVDEIVAEGFGTSSVIESHETIGQGVFKDGEWSVVIARPLKRENASVLDPSKNGYVAFAVWQGAKQEVGARKCVTMSWVGLQMNGGGQ